MLENFNNKNKSQEIKQLIQCVLISYRNGLNLRLLSKRFKEDIGWEIPFRELGFDSLLHLLREFNDCIGIRVQDNHENESDFIAYALTDERTQHIQQLVDKQKEENREIVLNPKSNNDVEKPLNNRVTAYKPYLLEVKEYDDLDLNSKMNDMMIGWNGKRLTRKPVCPLPYNRVVPLKERQRIQHLMKIYYIGINLHNFPSLYKLTHDEYPQYQKFGYSTLEEYLMDLSDLVQLIETENGLQVIPVKLNQNSSVHSNNGLNREKENVMNRLSNGFCKVNAINETTNGFLKHEENANKVTINGCLLSKENLCNNSIKDLRNGESFSSTIPLFVLENFRTILRINSEGMPAYKFSEEYFKLFKVPLIVGKWGFGSPLEMFFSLPNVFHLRKDAQKDMDEWILIENNPMIRSLTSENRQTKKRFDEELKKRVMYIVEKIKDSTPKSSEFLVEYFPDAYYLVYSEKFEAKQYGYNSLKQLFTDLSKVIDIDVKEKSKNKPFLIYKNKGLVINK